MSIFVARLGTYEGHVASRHEFRQDMYELGHVGVFHRSLQWPVECILKLQFSHGELCYMNWNRSPELIAAINAEKGPLRVPWLYVGKKSCVFACPEGSYFRFRYRHNEEVANWGMVRMDWRK